MPRIELPAPEALVDDHARRVLDAARLRGAYQLTLSSTLAALGVELHSSYLGYPAAPSTTVAHLLL